MVWKIQDLYVEKCKTLFRKMGKDQWKKSIHIGKEEEKLSLLADDMIVYIENHKGSTQKNIRTNEKIEESCKI